MKVLPPTFSTPIRIDSKLFTGKPIINPYDLVRMKRNGVTQIIDLRQHSHFLKLLEKIQCKVFGITYKNKIFKTDTDNIPTIDFFHNINNEIIQNNGKTYLHCKHGIHRTGMCIASYQKEVLKLENSAILKDFLKNTSTDKNIASSEKIKLVLDKFIDLFKLKNK